MYVLFELYSTELQLFKYKSSNNQTYASRSHAHKSPRQRSHKKFYQTQCHCAKRVGKINNSKCCLHFRFLWFVVIRSRRTQPPDESPSPVTGTSAAHTGLPIPFTTTTAHCIRYAINSAYRCYSCYRACINASPEL